MSTTMIVPIANAPDALAFVDRLGERDHRTSVRGSDGELPISHVSATISCKIGLTPEVGGRSSRPSHGLTTVVIRVTADLSRQNHGLTAAVIQVTADTRRAGPGRPPQDRLARQPLLLADRAEAGLTAAHGCGPNDRG
jgi:hypothetical protein